MSDMCLVYDGNADRDLFKGPETSKSPYQQGI